MFVGDLNLGEYYPSFGHGPRAYAERNYIFSKVQGIFDKADLLIGNLEAPITSRKVHAKESESMALRAEPRHAYQLKKAGFNILQVANNHTVQHSDEGFDDTIGILQEIGVSAVGVEGQDPVVITNNNTTYAFVAASDVPDNTNKKQRKYQQLDSSFIANIETQVQNYDHFIVLLHWGLEASTSPLPYQRELIDKLYSIGVRAVVGNHPHLFYEVEKRDNFICAYSLGNFVFDLCWDKRMEKTGILEIDFSKTTLEAKLHPVEIRENGCLPTPTGDAVSISNTVSLYDLGKTMDFQQVRKVLYFAINFHKGNTLLKIRFFWDKLSKIFK